MSDLLSNILNVIVIVFFFGFCVFIHEFGHLIVALWQGLHVEKFSVGMGPKLWGFTWRGVEYVISWLPFGGYVSLPQLDPTDAPKSSQGKPLSFATPKARALTAFAGPFFNVLFGFVLATIMWWAGLWRPIPVPAYNVADVPVVLPEMPKGLKTDDVICAIDDVAIPTLPYHLPATWPILAEFWKEVLPEPKTGKELQATVRHADGSQETLTIRPAVNPEWVGGVRAGDRIIQVNGIPLKDEQHFRSEYLFNDREKITLTVIRDGQTLVHSYTPAPNSAMEGLGYPFFAFQKPLQVTAISPASIASSIGLHSGDFITAINGVNLRSIRELNHLLAEHAGEKITIGLIHHGLDTMTECCLPEECTSAAAFGLLFQVEAEEVLPGMPAAQAGLLPGDTIQRVTLLDDDHQEQETLQVTDTAELSDFINHSAGRPMSLVCRRGGNTLTIPVTATLSQDTGRYVIGITLSNGQSRTKMLQHINPWQQFTEVIGTSTRTLGLLFAPLTSRAKGALTGHKSARPNAQIGVRHMSGPLGIVMAMWYKIKADGYRGGFAFIILITFSLAFMNLLPLPVLDGGHIVFAGIEALIHRRLPAKAINWLYNIFAVLLIGLMVYITFYDGKRLVKLHQNGTIRQPQPQQQIPSEE